MAVWTEQLVDWVEAINTRGMNLTTWEEQFIEDQVGRVERYGSRVVFSPAQAEIIERIYTEKVPL